MGGSHRSHEHDRHLPHPLLHHDQDQRGRDSMDQRLHCKETAAEEEDQQPAPSCIDQSC